MNRRLLEATIFAGAIAGASLPQPAAAQGERLPGPTAADPLSRASAAPFTAGGRCSRLVAGKLVVG